MYLGTRQGQARTASAPQASLNPGSSRSCSTTILQPENKDLEKGSASPKSDSNETSFPPDENPGANSQPAPHTHLNCLLSPQREHDSREQPEKYTQLKLGNENNIILPPCSTGSKVCSDCGYLLLPPPNPELCRWSGPDGMRGLMRTERKEVPPLLSQSSLMPQRGWRAAAAPGTQLAGPAPWRRSGELSLPVCCRARREQTEQGRQDRPRAKRTRHPQPPLIPRGWNLLRWAGAVARAAPSRS